MRQNVLHIYFFAKKAYVLSRQKEEDMEAWQVIKSTVDGVKDTNRRRAVVQHLRAVGYNNLHPDEDPQDVFCLDEKGAAVRRKINRGLGTHITRVSTNVSELLATISLNNDGEVFFATQQ